MKEKKGGLPFLRWPWNVVIYIVLILILRVFSIPFILVLLALQRNANPHGAAEGYCLSKTRKRLIQLPLGLFLLFFGVVLGYGFFLGLTMDRTYWDSSDWGTLAVSGVGMAVLGLLGGYTCYTSVRDTFFPARSALAQSIRSQLPYPEEAPPVEALFAMVDKDLEAGSQWFGPVGIGQEWVLGDQAVRIDRIRGIYTVDEIHTGSRRSRRILELVLFDDRGQKAVTDFRNPSDLQAAADCLALRVPEAARGRNSQRHDFAGMDESAREDFEREFRQKKSRRASAQTQQAAMSGGAQDMILNIDGQVTSRVSLSMVEGQLRKFLDGDGGSFILTPTKPIEAGGQALRALYVWVDTWEEDEQEIALTIELTQAGSSRPTGLSRTVDEQTARQVLAGWLRRQAPNLTGWERVPLYLNEANPRPARTRQASKARLSLLYASGAAENHTTFTRDDVQVAAEGLVDGTYQLVDLTLSNGYHWIRVRTGDKMDGRCTVEATRPDPDQLRFFTAKMSPRQAAAWLTGYPNGQYLPGGGDWKDCTKQMTKK